MNYIALDFIVQYDNGMSCLQLEYFLNKNIFWIEL